MCYLQVIGEQHQLVSHHMGLFTAKLKELQQKHGLVLGPIEVGQTTQAMLCSM